VDKFVHSTGVFARLVRPCPLTFILGYNLNVFFFYYGYHARYFGDCVQCCLFKAMIKKGLTRIGDGCDQLRVGFGKKPVNLLYVVASPPGNDVCK
jgi:hypothetical protein